MASALEIFERLLKLYVIKKASEQVCLKTICYIHFEKIGIFPYPKYDLQIF